MPASEHESQPLAALAIELLFQYGMRELVIAPGSRSAPLTLAATRHGGLRTHLVYDERSAAYTALGIAQQSKLPVGIICSSGTAALNFAPAIAEAYYQRIPLIALTADRPAEWIDQIDNQAIRQNHLYAPHVRASFVYPVDDGQAETRWHAARIIGDAWSIATATPAGPVHINIPLREPLYRPTTPPIPDDSPLRRARTLAATRQTLDGGALQSLGNLWSQARRKLILVGQHQPDPLLDDALTRLLHDPSVAALADVTGNLAPHPNLRPFAHWEGALATHESAALAPLLPDLALWIGGQITSKAIKTLLRQHPPAHFWRVDADLPAADAFQANTAVLPLEASHFLDDLALHLESSAPAGDGGYAAAWAAASAGAHAIIAATLQMGASPMGENPMGESLMGESLMGESLMGESPIGESQMGESLMGESLMGESLMGESLMGENPMGASLMGASLMGESPIGESQMGESTRAAFSEIAATQRVLQALPAGGKLQLGNSMPIRLVNLLGVDAHHTPARIDANRGTSGIDGAVSTAVGAAHASSELVTLLVGDLGFFYDRNGLWQRQLPANLRIILLNNHGGGIFDVIEGPNTLSAAERSAWFLTPNPLTARRTAEEHGLRYHHATDAKSLSAALSFFFAASDSPALLEIETEMATNSRAWKAVVTALRTRSIVLSPIAPSPIAHSPHNGGN